MDGNCREWTGIDGSGRELSGMDGNCRSRGGIARHDRALLVTRLTQKAVHEVAPDVRGVAADEDHDGARVEVLTHREDHSTRICSGIEEGGKPCLGGVGGGQCGRGRG